MQKVPDGLGAEAATLWRKITKDYALDAAGQAILRNALEALQRMREAQAVLAAEGLVVRDRFDQPKPHPAAAIERDNRDSMLRHLRALGMEAEA